MVEYFRILLKKHWTRKDKYNEKASLKSLK